LPVAPSSSAKPRSSFPDETSTAARIPESIRQ
jgi:hypothetical protein